MTAAMAGPGLIWLGKTWAWTPFFAALAPLLSLITQTN